MAKAISVRLDGDAERAEDVMRRHIQSFERSIRAVL